MTILFSQNLNFPSPTTSKPISGAQLIVRQNEIQLKITFNGGWAYSVNGTTYNCSFVGLLGKQDTILYGSKISVGDVVYDLHDSTVSYSASGRIVYYTIPVNRFTPGYIKLFVEGSQNAGIKFSAKFKSSSTDGTSEFNSGVYVTTPSTSGILIGDGWFNSLPLIQVSSELGEVIKEKGYGLRTLSLGKINRFDPKLIQVDDEDTNDTINVKYELNGTLIKTLSNVLRNTDLTLDLNDVDGLNYFKDLPLGNHQLKIIVEDVKGGA